MSQRIAVVVLTFWLGALWFTGLAANITFNTISDKKLAGTLAGQFFTVISYIGIVSAVYLLIRSFRFYGQSALKKTSVRVLISMLLLIVIGHFGIQTILANLKSAALPADVMASPYAKQFGLWHGVAGVIYLIECVLGVELVLNLRSDQNTII